MIYHSCGLSYDENWPNMTIAAVANVSPPKLALLYGKSISNHLKNVMNVYLAHYPQSATHFISFVISVISLPISGTSFIHEDTVFLKKAPSGTYLILELLSVVLLRGQDLFQNKQKGSH